MDSNRDIILARLGPGAKIKSRKAKSKPVATVTSADTFRSSVPSSSQVLERVDPTGQSAFPTAVVALSPGSASVPSQGKSAVEASRLGRDCHGGSAALEEGRSPSRGQACADGQSIPTVSAPVLGNGVSAATPSPRVVGLSPEHCLSLSARTRLSMVRPTLWPHSLGGEGGTETSP